MIPILIDRNAFPNDVVDVVFYESRPELSRASVNDSFRLKAVEHNLSSSEPYWLEVRPVFAYKSKCFTVRALLKSQKLYKVIENIVAIASVIFVSLAVFSYMATNGGISFYLALVPLFVFEVSIVMLANKIIQIKNLFYEAKNTFGLGLFKVDKFLNSMDRDLFSAYQQQIIRTNPKVIPVENHQYNVLVALKSIFQETYLEDRFLEVDPPLSVNRITQNTPFFKQLARLFCMTTDEFVKILVDSERKLNLTFFEVINPSFVLNEYRRRFSMRSTTLLRRHESEVPGESEVPSVFEFMRQEETINIRNQSEPKVLLALRIKEFLKKLPPGISVDLLESSYLDPYEKTILSKVLNLPD